MRLFVFGLGYSARAAVAHMRPRLEAVWGTTRNPGKFSEIDRLGVTPLVFDGGPLQATKAKTRGGPVPQGGRRQNASEPEDRELGGGRPPSPPDSGVPESGNMEPKSEPSDFGWRGDGGGATPSEGASGSAQQLATALASADHILVSIAPDESGDPVINCHRADLAALRPKSIVYLSTVGVYGDHHGAWVDEASPCRPVSKRSHQRVEAEAAWRDFAEETGVPVAIVRLSGIYGPGRGPFEKIRRGTARRIIKPDQVFNRIHADDIAAIVEAALTQRADGIFNGSDDEPAPPQDVLAFAADLLGVPPPPEVAFAAAELTPMARTFYGENKRVRNERIKRVLGVRLAHPTYREGLLAVLRAEASGR